MSIDLENAKSVFMEYVSNYDKQDSNTNRKVYHSLRVMELSKKIATSLNLSEAEVDVATLIGLLHDIGRFEQYKIYQTLSCKRNIDHGDLGVQILEKNNFIRKFIKTDKYDEIIKTAIKNHNKFKIENGLDEKTSLFCQIIRDADKLDIFYEAVEMFWNTEKEKNEIENSVVSDDYFEKLTNCQMIEKDKNVHSKIDSVVFIINFMYDINTEFAYAYILEKDFVNKLLNRFNYLPYAKEQVEQIKNACISYVKNKIEQTAKDE